MPQRFRGRFRAAAPPIAVAVYPAADSPGGHADQTRGFGNRVEAYAYHARIVALHGMLPRRFYNLAAQPVENS